MRTVLVPAARVVRWFENFQSRHGALVLVVADGTLLASTEDGSRAAARLPFDRPYAGPPAPDLLADAVRLPDSWGVLLVRRGGFAVVSMAEDAVVRRKTGRRHVQGRTKAGGQSQQRFARRRDNQARAAYDAATEHAVAVLPADLEALVTGGDRQGVDAVLGDPRLRRIAEQRVSRWLPVPDPRSQVLDQAVIDAAAIGIEVTEPGP